MEVLESEHFKVFLHQTLTGIFSRSGSETRLNIGHFTNASRAGLKIIAISDPIHMSLDAPIRRIYELYSDYAMKNPFFLPDMPIRAELFDLAIQKLIKQINNVS